MEDKDVQHWPGPTIPPADGGVADSDEPSVGGATDSDAAQDSDGLAEGGTADDGTADGGTAKDGPGGGPQHWPGPTTSEPGSED